MKFPAWSYSALTSWESCPRKHYETRVAKRWPDEKSEAAQWGTTAHTAFEDRMKTKKPLPSWFEKYEPICQRIEGANGHLTVEQKLALDEKFQAVDYFSKQPPVWVRAVADLSVIGDVNLFTLDWKTGKFKPDTDQLRLSAAISMSHYRHIRQATVQYVFLKEGKTLTEQIKREQVVEIWRDFLPRVQRMKEGFESERWEEKPNGLCRAYCPVLNCQFNGRRK